MLFRLLTPVAVPKVLLVAEATTPPPPPGPPPAVDAGAVAAEEDGAFSVSASLTFGKVKVLVWAV